ncbi:LOW QUALITY PROTEIN: uncharacterized protein [Centruroides vittatus]|uniref:LOW QUALITY PROTEIN: uncharacterized protein n=1 Tax=Centruroides vittatus TaxID=120091 RepID=UPI00350FFF92
MQSDREGSSLSGHNSPVTTKVVTKRVVSGPLAELEPNLKANVKHEEWTTKKKVVNHKTKQVETRVQRQIVLEDGKVIADSGPQISTRTKEDNRTEETEDTEHKTVPEDHPEPGYVPVPGAVQVVSEKTETRQVMKETKEENMQLHDERIHELTGSEMHHMALTLPEDIPYIGGDPKQFPGKLTHYSSRSNKVTDKDEIKEVSQLKDGELTTETTRTHHHEETCDDEVPEDEVDGLPLPEMSAETTRKIEYYADDELDSLSEKMRRETAIRELMERHDPLTKKNLDVEEEEEIRNCETNRWLENHFGSDESDVVETSKTKAGGNVIKIQMSSTKRPKEPEQSRMRESRTHEYNESRQSTPRRPATPPTVYFRNTSKSPNGEKSPVKTYYMGENANNRWANLKKSTWKSTPSLTDNLSARTESKKYENHDSFRHDQKQHTTVQRSHSQRDPVRRYDVTPKRSYLLGDDPATLPRNYTNRESHHRSERLSNNKITHEDRETQTLPRHSSKKNPRSILTNSRTPKTFYFGDETDTSYHNQSFRSDVSSFRSQSTQDLSKTASDRFHSTHSLKRSPHNYSQSIHDLSHGPNYQRFLDKRNELRSTPIYHTIERDTSNRRMDKRDFRNYSYSDHERSMGDSYNETNGRVYNGHSESKRHDFMRRLLDNCDHESSHSWSRKSGSSPRVYEHRFRSSSPIPRLIRYSNSTSPSPPESPTLAPSSPSLLRHPPDSRTSTLSSRRSAAGRTKSYGPVTNPPNFSPLSSPLEIRNMTKHGGSSSRNGHTHTIEVRDWGNR